MWRPLWRKNIINVGGADVLCVCVYAYPLHGVLVVSQVVEAEGNSCCRHGRPGDLQELLNSSMSDELGSKLLVEEQRGQILMGDEVAYLHVHTSSNKITQ